MVEHGVTKTLYKIELLTIKMIPYIIMVCYFLNSLLSYFDIDTQLLSLIGGLSVLPLIFLLISSFVFKFCIYHRLPLYYVIVVDVLNYYDSLVGLPISNRSLFVLNMLILGIFVLLIVFYKFKQHGRTISK